MTVKAHVAVALSNLWMVSGCVDAQPRTPVDYSQQRDLLQTVLNRLEESPRGPEDAEIVRLLYQLRDRIEDAECRHLEDEQEIQRLTEEIDKLRRAANFSVAGIRILYFTHVVEQGIDLWVSPLDDQGDEVKSAGSFVISLHRPLTWGEEKLGRKICIWRFTPEQVCERWEGQLWRGYHLKLSWPEGKDIDIKTGILKVEFHTVDGRALVATKGLVISE